jgi:peptidyl-prolyl cis-trans isomerase A (cyclophilin A)
MPAIHKRQSAHPAQTAKIAFALPEYNCCQMKLFVQCFAAMILAAGAVPAQSTGQAPGAPGPAAPARAVIAPLAPGVYAEIDTSMGPITCVLFEKDAPRTVANFRGLVTGSKAWTDPRDGKTKHVPFYTGLTFHRVIKNFMIQGGDPAGDGTGGPGYSIDDEISQNYHFDKPGMLAMAKRSSPNTAGSQFFITTAPAAWLEGNYSIFGEVLRGQDIADRISEVATDENDKPISPVRIVRIRIRTIHAATAHPPAHPRPAGKRPAAAPHQ